MEEYTGKAALDELATRWAHHDPIIHNISVRRVLPVGVGIETQRTARAESSVAESRLCFEEVSRFDISCAGETELFLVPGYKAMLLPSSEVYLALNPYDDRVAEPDERDCSVIVARQLRVSFMLK